MLGGWGYDLVAAGPGNDLVFGGPNADEIHGGPGIDLLYGQWGDDSFWAEPTTICCSAARAQTASSTATESISPEAA